MSNRGLQIIPNSTQVIQGANAQIYLHGRVDNSRSDFDYIFSPIYQFWQGLLLVDGYCKVLQMDDTFEDPMPTFQNLYGEQQVHSFSEKHGLVATYAEALPNWGPYLHGGDWQTFLIYQDLPDYDEIAELYYSDRLHFSWNEWPAGLRTIVMCIDGLFWQIFSQNDPELENLFEIHKLDPSINIEWILESK